MIFRREEPSVKRLTTEPLTQESVDPNSMFEYRTEISSTQKRILIENRDGYLRNIDVSNFVRAAALAHHLGILATSGRNAFVEQRFDTNLHAFCHNPQTSSQFFEDIWYSILLYPELARRPEVKDRIPQVVQHLIHREGNVFPLWSELLCARLLDPNATMPEMTPEKRATIEEQVISLQDTENWDNAYLTENEFRDAALARLAGYEEVPQILNISPSRIRAHIFPTPDNIAHVETFAELAFYARVLNAERVYIDQDGLHIVDPPLKATASAPKPPPTPKHL